MPTTINKRYERRGVYAVCRAAWWAPNGVPGANPARPALPNSGASTRNARGWGMTDACHHARVLHLLNPPGRTKHRTQAAPEGAPGYAALCPIPGGEGPKTAHQAAPKVPLVDAALCPGPLRRQETRGGSGPHAGKAVAACKGNANEAGNVPTPRSIPPHGGRAPGLTPHGDRAHATKASDHQTKRNSAAHAPNAATDRCPQAVLATADSPKAKVARERVVAVELLMVDQW